MPVLRIYTFLLLRLHPEILLPLSKCAAISQTPYPLLVAQARVGIHVSKQLLTSSMFNPSRCFPTDQKLLWDIPTAH
jgi:hypothetical protein